MSETRTPEDPLAERIASVEAAPLSERAAGFTALHDELSAELTATERADLR